MYEIVIPFRVDQNLGPVYKTMSLIKYWTWSIWTWVATGQILYINRVKSVHFQVIQELNPLHVLKVHLDP
jgi:hypothetical protein